MLADMNDKGYTHLFVTPEMSIKEEVVQWFSAMGPNLGLLVFDEAHCIAEW